MLGVIRTDRFFKEFDFIFLAASNIEFHGEKRNLEVLATIIVKYKYIVAT
jgi:hypothetical protein